MSETTAAMRAQTRLPWGAEPSPLPGMSPGPCGAIISECGRYRPLLWRCWGAGPWWCVVGQNPSVADGQVDDPTLRRVVGLCREGGAGGVVLVNTFDYRATRPEDCSAALARGEALGPDCDHWLVEASRSAQRTICAWGQVHRTRLERVERVVELLGGPGRLEAWATTAEGWPRHPLYLSTALRPTTWSPPAPKRR